MYTVSDTACIVSHSLVCCSDNGLEGHHWLTQIYYRKITKQPTIFDFIAFDNYLFDFNEQYCHYHLKTIFYKKETSTGICRHSVFEKKTVKKCQFYSFLVSVLGVTDQHALRTLCEDFGYLPGCLNVLNWDHLIACEWPEVLNVTALSLLLISWTATKL